MPSPGHASSKTKRFTIIGVAAAIVVALLCVWAWTGGLGKPSDPADGSVADVDGRTQPSSGLVAAKVGELEIPEDAVTEEIMELRASNGLESQEAWNGFLDTMGYEPETLREQVITRRVNEELIAEECAARGLDLSEAELDAAVAEEKASFASPEAWAAYLQNYGLDEERFKASLKATLLSERLQGALVEESTESWSELSDAEREQAILGGADVLNEWLTRQWEAGGISVQAMPSSVPYGRSS